MTRGRSAAELTADGRIQGRGLPPRELHFIVPFAAGGPGDMLARLIGKWLAQCSTRKVTFENIHGSNGISGSAKAAAAVPDGRTVLMAASAHYINPSIYRWLPFDPLKDFAPVSLIAAGSNVLAVHPSLPVSSSGELIAWAKQRPGAVRYASGGHGSPSHLAGELFKIMAGVDLAHVPYPGHVAAGVALSDGREVQLMFDAVMTALPNLESGRWHALAVTTAKRCDALPTVPTLAESSLPGYEVSPSIGVLAPAAMPAGAVEELSAQIASIVQTREIADELMRVGSQPVGSTPRDYAVYMMSEIEKWARVVKDARIEVRDAPGL